VTQASSRLAVGHQTERNVPLGWFGGIEQCCGARPDPARALRPVPTVERAGDNLLLVEDYLARSGGEENALEEGAPLAAGGAL
jgi:hypothetical protein